MAIDNFSIVDTTLREGEQFINASFSSRDRIEIAKALSDFGVEYIELPSPLVSPQTENDIKKIVKLGLGPKIATHIRCNKEDVKRALDTGVSGLNIFIGTSHLLREYSIHKSINEIVDLVQEVLVFAREQSPNIELRFSGEDSFRSPIKDLLKVYTAIENLQIIDRFGIPDTVGIATPQQVTDLVKLIRSITKKDIEFHGHNDTGCAVANSYVAVEAGATHIDTTVLGIGERNGITSLAGFIARIYTLNRDVIKNKYNLKVFKELHEIVSKKVGIEISTNHYIFGSAAFSHKAGIHTNAVLMNPETYEIIDPKDFGLERKISIAHKLTGAHSIRNRAKELGFDCSKEQMSKVTVKIKEEADKKNIDLNKVDEIINNILGKDKIC